MSGVKTNGNSICGNGSRSREPHDLLVLQRCALGAERGRVREVVGLALRHETVARLGVGQHLGGDSEPLTPGGQRREALVDDDGSERDAGAVLDRERGVDHLAHRCLLGQGDEHHLAAGRIREQGDDV